MLGLPLTINWLKVGISIGVLIAFGFLVWFDYHTGYKSGSDHVQLAWNKQKILDTAEAKKQEDKYQLALDVYNTDTGALNVKVLNLQNTTDTEIANIRADYTKRLLLSDTRSKIYHDQAQGSSTQRSGLADYASQLDRSLEQGRQLVQEFRTTLRQRDQQLDILSTQILNERKLLDDGSAPQSAADGIPAK